MNPLSHSQAHTMMMEALDGRLAPQQRAALDGHVAGCAECRAAWQDLQRVDRLLAEARVMPAPPGFSRRVSARLDEVFAASAAKAPSVFSREEWVRALAGAGVLSLGGVAVLVLGLLPLFSTTANAVSGLLSPAQLPMLLSRAQDLLEVAATVGRGVLGLLNGFDLLVRTHPALILALVGAFVIVALWAWTVQQLAAGRTASRTYVWL